MPVQLITLVIVVMVEISENHNHTQTRGVEEEYCQKECTWRSRSIGRMQRIGEVKRASLKECRLSLTWSQKSLLRRWTVNQHVSQQMGPSTSSQCGCFGDCYYYYYYYYCCCCCCCGCCCLLVVVDGWCEGNHSRLSTSKQRNGISTGHVCMYVCMCMCVCMKRVQGRG